MRPPKVEERFCESRDGTRIAYHVAGEGPPILLLNYKDVTTLARFLTEQGKILPKRTTKVTARFQRQLGTAVKRARYLALLPYIRDHEA